MANQLRDLAADGFGVPLPMTGGPSAQAYLEATGEQGDLQSDGDRAVLKLRQTSGALMQATARRLGVEVLDATGDAERLRRLGASKGLTQYPGESDAQFQERIDAAIASEGLRGTVAGLKAQLRAFGLVDVEVVEECYSQLGGPGVPYAFKFVVVLGPDFGALGWKPLTMPFPLGAAYLGIAGLTAGQASTLVRIVLDWKTAASFPLALVWRFGDAPVLGHGDLLLPFPLGGSPGSGYARRPIGEQALLGGDLQLNFALWGGYWIGS